jgi:hypothetical protein
MVDFSKLADKLFNTSLVTHTYKLGDEIFDLTPTGLTPAGLLKKLYENGASLVVLGDTNHTEIGIKSTLSSLLGDKSIKITKFASELDSNDQSAYDNFVKGDDKKLKEFILPPNDSYAPNAEKNPELREKYFAEKWKTYEVTRDNKIKVAFVDAQNEELESEANFAHNKIYELKRNHSFTRYLRDEKGNPKDIKLLSKVELDALKEQLSEGFKAAGVVVSTAAINNTPASQWINLSKGFFRDIGLDYESTHSSDEIRKATQKRLEVLEIEKLVANGKRDDWRNKEMAKKISSFISPVSVADECAVFMVGAGHLGNKDRAEIKSKNPNLEQLLRDRFSNKVVRVDIMPVSEKAVKELGVSIGGRNGADYTIFITGEVSEFLVHDTGKSVPASQGSHKDRLKPLELSQAEIIPAAEAKITVAYDNAYFPNPHHFESGLSSSVSKGTTIKNM